MNEKYKFEDQIRHRYDSEIFELIQDTFKFLPLAATVENKVFILHGKVKTHMNRAYNVIILQVVYSVSKMLQLMRSKSEFFFFLYTNDLGFIAKNNDFCLHLELIVRSDYHVTKIFRHANNILWNK